jgi:hypothetical protein
MQAKDRDELMGQYERPTKSDHVNRRNFLTAVSATGLVTAATLLSGGSSGAQEGADSGSVPRLASLDNLIVLREDTLPIPNGDEHFYEWQASDERGVSSSFLVHGWRTDSGDTYTVTTDVTVRRFPAGADTTKEPASTSSQRVVVFGVKGVVTGSIRQDRVITTTIEADGTTNRSEQTVRVRLYPNNSFTLDLKTAATNAGNRWLGTR